MSWVPTLAGEVLRRAARDREDLVVAVQRDLHRIPEPGFREQETTRYVAQFLAARGIEFRPASGGTGGVAAIGAGSPRVLLRADLDALPLEEETDCPHRSRHPGWMHACGHDAHTAMLLVAADALASGDLPVAGRVVCVFQPAEEGPGGCRALLEQGLLEREPADLAVALHVWPGLPTGTVGLSPGPVMASMDRLRMVFRGRGGHGAHPEQCVDPVVMAAQAVMALQTLVSRRVDPLDPAVLTIGSIHGGTACNIIPDCVELLATVRAYEASTRAALLAGVRAVGQGVAAAQQGQFECTVEEGYPVTRNAPEVVGPLAAALAEVLGEGAVRPGQRTMGSEDMSLVLERVPGCYLQLGAAADPSCAAPLHSSRFQIDPACLPVGVSVLLAAATLTRP